MLLSLLRSGNVTEFIINICVRIFVVFCILPIHEFAHALVATRMGDDTARLKGRLTLSPLAHINWIGALMILLVGFGYAEPVPVNIRNVRMKNKKAAMALIALAGPVSNLIVAFVSMLLSSLTIRLGNPSSLLTSSFIIFFNYCALINISLAVFNFIPVPPLDGSRVLFAVIPTKYYFGIMKYERYIEIAIFVLLFTGILSTPLSWITQAVYSGMALFFNILF